MATIGDIKNGLALGKSEAEKAMGTAAAAVAQVDKAIAVYSALMAGTQQPAIMSAIGKLNASKQKLNEAVATMRSATDDSDKYNAVL